MIKLPQGGRAPLTLSVAITPADQSLDLTTVTSVALNVLRQDGVQVTWAATIASGATPTSLTVNYTFASDGSDLTVTGTYKISPVLSVPGGSVDGTAIDAFIESPFNFRQP